MSPPHRASPRPPRRLRSTGTCHLTLCAILSALASLAIACSSQAPNVRESLPLSVDDFHSHLIWGRYSEAAGYLPVAEQATFLGAQEQIGDELRYTEYEVGAIDVTDQSSDATVTVTLKWYRVPQYIVQTTRVRETWTFDEEAEKWWLTRREVANPMASP